MEIQQEQVGDVWVVNVHGRLDGITSTAFSNHVGELFTGRIPKILIDLTDMDFITSAGLRELLLLAKKANASGTAFALCGVNDQVRQVVDIGGFTTIFNLHSGRAEALAALKG